MALLRVVRGGFSFWVATDNLFKFFILARPQINIKFTVIHFKKCVSKRFRRKFRNSKFSF